MVSTLPLGPSSTMKSHLLSHLEEGLAHHSVGCYLLPGQPYLILPITLHSVKLPSYYSLGHHGTMTWEVHGMAPPLHNMRGARAWRFRGKNMDNLLICPSLHPTATACHPYTELRSSAGAAGVHNQPRLSASGISYIETSFRTTRYGC